MEERKPFLLTRLDQDFLRNGLKHLIHGLRVAPSGHFLNEDERTDYIEYASNLEKMFEESLRD